HVRDVEHAGVAAHLVVLLHLRAVVQRHVPAAEVHHPGAERAVGIVEDGLAGHGMALGWGSSIIAEELARHPALRATFSPRAGRRKNQAGSTWSCMPSAPVMRTRVPAGRSGPSTVQ